MHQIFYTSNVDDFILQVLQTFRWQGHIVVVLFVFCQEDVLVVWSLRLNIKTQKAAVMQNYYH